MARTHLPDHLIILKYRARVLICSNQLISYLSHAQGNFGTANTQASTSLRARAHLIASLLVLRLPGHEERQRPDRDHRVGAERSRELFHALRRLKQLFGRASLALQRSIAEAPVSPRDGSCAAIRILDDGHATRAIADGAGLDRLAFALPGKAWFSFRER